jgi:hypothetical protein
LWRTLAADNHRLVRMVGSVRGQTSMPARAGRLDDTRLTSEKMLTYANHMGHYSEEISLNGERTASFPQHSRISP